MILTGAEIVRRVQDGSICLDPYDPAHVNPNSYNYCLGDKLIEKSCLESDVKVTIPDTGMVLYPGKLYLGSTYEVIGSTRFTTLLIGRSSVGRLGLHLQVDADLGHRDSVHSWTLELVARKPIRVYPRMIIGQVTFWTTDQSMGLPVSGYANFQVPITSLVEGVYLP